MHTSNIRINTPAEIFSSATIFSGPDGDITYWYASVSVMGFEIACVGVNGEGRYKTRKSAERAALSLAREKLSR